MHNPDFQRRLFRLHELLKAARKRRFRALDALEDFARRNPEYASLRDELKAADEEIRQIRWEQTYLRG